VAHEGGVIPITGFSLYSPLFYVLLRTIKTRAVADKVHDDSK